MSWETLLYHPRVVATLADPASSFWLKGLLTSAAERDPVDVQSDLWHASRLVDLYVGELLELDPLRPSPRPTWRDDSAPSRQRLAAP